MTESPGPDPLELLEHWYAEAVAAGARDPDAMALGTATREGLPSVRIVLYKGLVQGRIRFVTHYASRKAREIDENPRVALAFYWPELRRQVRIQGTAARASKRDSDAYFETRPRESQLGAWASPQSQPLSSRRELERLFAETERRFHERSIERPPDWGAYWVEPDSVELWIAAAHRLHDRFSYTRADSGWTVRRLAP